MAPRRDTQIPAKMSIIQFRVRIIPSRQPRVINRSTHRIQICHLHGTRFMRPISILILSVYMIVLLGVYHECHLTRPPLTFLRETRQLASRDISQYTRQYIRASLSLHIGPLGISAGKAGLRKGGIALLFCALFWQFVILKRIRIAIIGIFQTIEMIIVIRVIQWFIS